MKVAITTEMGCSYGLSEEAVAEYIRRSGIEIFRYYRRIVKDVYEIVYSTIDIGIPELSTIPRQNPPSDPEQLYWCHGRWSASEDIERHDPILIDIVEELGSRAAGEFMDNFTIVEIPDDVKYWIIEHEDGSELIAEQHRTWP